MRLRSVGVTLCFFAMSLCGCNGGGGTGDGAGVLVSRPEVFTRERLVNRRLHEAQFLEKRLDKFEQGVQGFRDVREFSGLIAQARGSFDPAAGAASALGVANLQRQEEAAALQHRINVALLQQQLAATLASPSTQPATQPGAATPAAANQQAALTHPTDTLPGISAFAGRPPLPTPADVVASQAKPTAVEALRDEVAYRDAIQAMLREKELDDTHDLRGYTLYTLKFDLTTMPGVTSDKFARVKLTLPKPSGATTRPTAEDVRNTFYQWRDRFRRDVTAEAINLQRAYGSGELTDMQRIRLADRMAQSQRILRYREQKRSSERLKKRLAVYDLRADAPQEARAALRKLLCELAQAKYEALSSRTDRAGGSGEGLELGELVVFGEPRPGKGPLEGFWIPAIDEEDDVERDLGRLDQQRLDRFANDLRELAVKAEPYVYAVEPKEYAQNISDVAATEKLRNYVVALQAILPQAGATASGSLNRLDQSMSKIHAILRKPLVVGYENGPREFGWIVGPHLTLDGDGKVRYAHRPVQQSVQVTVAVPAWAKTLTLRGERLWEGEGRPESLWTKDDGSGTQDQVVDLPADPTALTQALMAQAGAEWRAPEIYPRWPRDATPMFAGPGAPPQTFLIRGTDLWRNPQVFAGDQRATGVEVLPDMRGLLATFEKLQMPPTPGGRPVTVDVTVVTSAGITTLPDAVTLVPAAAGAAGVPKVALGATFGVGGGELLVRTDPATFPTTPLGLALRIRPAGQSNLEFVEVKRPSVVDDKRTTIRFTLPDDLSTGIYEADVRIKPTLQDDPVSLPIVGRRTFVGYAKATGAPVATFTQKAIAYDQRDAPTGAGSLTFPTDPGGTGATLFHESYPGLKDAMAAGLVRLVLQKDPNDKAIAVALRGAPAGAVVDPGDLLKGGAVPPAKAAADANADVTVEFKAVIDFPGNAVGPIPVANGPLSVKRAKP